MTMLSCWNKFFDLNEITLLQTQTTGKFKKISAPEFLLSNQSMTGVGNRNKNV